MDLEIFHAVNFQNAQIIFIINNASVNLQNLESLEMIDQINFIESNLIFLLVNLLIIYNFEKIPTPLVNGFSSFSLGTGCSGWTKFSGNHFNLFFLL